MAKKKLDVIVDDSLKDVKPPDPVQAPPLDKPVKPKRTISAETAERLRLGREKLAERWANIRKEKEVLQAKALEKAVKSEIKKKETVMKQYGIQSLSDSESEESEEEEIQAPPVKEKKKVVKAVVKAQAAPPKKKSIKYVEVSSSESEEEVVIFKKQKKSSTRDADQYPPTAGHSIVFY